MELGKNSPSIRMLYRLCDALNVRPWELLKDVDMRIAREGSLASPPD